MTPDDPRMIRLAHAAKLLGVSARTLRNYQRRGLLPAAVQYVRGGPSYVPREAVERVAAGQREAGSA